MSVDERLAADTRQAMRDGDKVRLGALRRARAELKNAEIAAKGDLGDDEAVATLRRLVKQHEESIEQFRAGGRDDLVARETAEMEALEPYLPTRLGEDDIAVVVREVIEAEGISDAGDLGRVMKRAMGRLQGQADGALVRAVAERELGGTGAS